MITVTVNNKYMDNEFNYDDTENYSVNATFIANEDINASELMAMFRKAMLLEGYMETSIYKAMLETIYEYDLNAEETIRKFVEEDE